MLGDYIFERLMVIHHTITCLSVVWVFIGTFVIGFIYAGYKDENISYKRFKQLMTISGSFWIFALLYLVLTPSKELTEQILKSWIY